MKTTGIIIIAFAMMIAFTGVVMADQVVPAFGNIVQTGSKYDLAIGSVFTTADNRFVGTDATTPVVQNYAITVKPYTIYGQGTSPAIGSVSSFFTSSIKEGRTGYWGDVSGVPGYTTPPYWQQLHWNDFYDAMAHGNMSGVRIGPQNMDLTYSESSSASGIINSFSTTYAYQSGKVLIP